jgi:hypothetical protein
VLPIRFIGEARILSSAVPAQVNSLFDLALDSASQGKNVAEPWSGCSTVAIGIERGPCLPVSIHVAYVTYQPFSGRNLDWSASIGGGSPGFQSASVTSLGQLGSASQSCSEMRRSPPSRSVRTVPWGPVAAASQGCGPRPLVMDDSELARRRKRSSAVRADTESGAVS